MVAVRADLSLADQHKHTADTSIEEVLEDLEADYGEYKSGWVCIAWMDREESDHFEQVFYRWPKEKYQAARYTLSKIKQGHCVWKPTALLKAAKRREAVDSDIISFEVDEPLTTEKQRVLDSLNPTVLNSGRPGHFHVKLKIDTRLSHTENAELSVALANYLGITGKNGGKFQPHDLLRIAGSYNTKPGVGRKVELQKVGKGTSVERLRKLVGYISPKEQAEKGGLVSEPMNRARLPQEIRSMLRQHDTGDGTARYKQTHKLVKLCAENGFTKEQALWCLEQHAPSVGKFGLWRLPSQVHSSWPKSAITSEKENTSSEAEKLDIEIEDEIELDEDQEEFRDLMVPGGEFILRAPKKVPALWGHEGSDVWWSPGEGLMITGTTGVGKSTLAGLLVRGRMGFLDQVAGYPVVPGKKKVLYLAMDRPRQIQRALRRQFGDLSEEQINTKLAVWSGPPPSSFEEDHKLLLRLAHAAGADTVVVDSLKDAIPKPSNEDAGGAWNRNVQHCNFAGIEVMVLHHQRKESNGENARKPKSMSDVYGSNWLTAGLGSVILLWRESGKDIEISQLKGPAGEGNFIKLHLDNERGTLSTPHSDEEKLAFFADLHTAAHYARWLKGDEDVTRAEITAARRECEQFVDAELLVREPSPPTAERIEKNAHWFRTL